MFPASRTKEGFHLTASIIMLTYNREQLVGRAIRSVLLQTHSDFEFIIVDNGSTDRSGEIADLFAAEDSRVRVLHRERGNIGGGRNTGLAAVRGSYIAFVDDDDTVEPDFLEFLLNLAQSHDADVAICGASDRIYNELLVMNAEQALLELMRRKRYNAGFPTKLFHRDLVRGLRFPEYGVYDDIALMYRLLAAARRVAYHGLPKYVLNRHPGNTSAWTTDHRLLTPSTLREYLSAYRERTDWLSRKFPDSADAFRYYEWSFMLSMVEKIERLNIEACRAALSDMVDALRAHRTEFLSGTYTQAQEREWMERYVG